MSLSFRKRQPIPELHIDEAARAAAAPYETSESIPAVGVPDLGGNSAVLDNERDA